MKRYGRGLWPMLALFLLLLVSLSFMSDATHNSERFGRLYSLLLVTNALGLVVLIVLIGANLGWLLRQYRKRAAGARLTSRLVGMFVVLAVLPVSVVYYFSLQFLQQGIDSWFNVQIEESLEDAMALSQSAFDVRLRDLFASHRGIGRRTYRSTLPACAAEPVRSARALRRERVDPYRRERSHHCLQ
jgi:nitrogen fixation/metabolism regulation signal transduction histidine kinase